MTKEEFRCLRHQLGWSQARLAEALGTTKTSVYRYEAGLRKIPPPVARLLQVLAAMRQGDQPIVIHARPRQPRE